MLTDVYCAVLVMLLAIGPGACTQIVAITHSHDECGPSTAPPRPLHGPRAYDSVAHACTECRAQMAFRGMTITAVTTSIFKDNDKQQQQQLMVTVLCHHAAVQNLGREKSHFQLIAFSFG